ncbi:hypothetical protein M2403_002478 [Rahnella sp. BIGb0603]|uniref:hypothetical protein n=1 Tax=Rahnella TaxID=34037 RepID=UPI00216A1768|nr:MULTISPECIES: hypothetical protein [Rahnella]MCS3423865.1 hypothetical protein [Rahnella sp. BIGb0603]MDF1892691.1 hypothetical protein [Rahnella contaminans]
MAKNIGSTIQDSLLFLDFQDVNKGRTFVLLTSIISIQRNAEGALITLDSGLEISVHLSVTAVMSTIAYAVKNCRRSHPEVADTIPAMFIFALSEEDKASLDRPMEAIRYAR